MQEGDEDKNGAARIATGILRRSASLRERAGREEGVGPHRIALSFSSISFSVRFSISLISTIDRVSKSVSTLAWTLFDIASSLLLLPMALRGDLGVVATDIAFSFL